MKRDRNTFFQNYNAQTQSYIPTPNMNTQFGPYQSASTQSQFYAGPNLDANQDIENRLAKIERQINRLDSRLSKLENTSPNINTNIDNNYSNMYML